jgi:tetratricopeptide (TPR) repeat protein
MTIMSKSIREFIVRCSLAALCLALAACIGKSPDEWLSKAKELRQKGERTAAILEVKSLIQEHSEHGEARFFLGSLYNESADYAGAEKELRRALELKVDPERVLPALARSLVMQGTPRNYSTRSPRMDFPIRARKPKCSRREASRIFI